MLEDRLHNFDDIVFSCFLPDDWLNEFRMPQHVLVYVYAGFLIKRTFYDTSYHADRLVESATQNRHRRTVPRLRQYTPHPLRRRRSTVNISLFIHTTKVFIPIIFYSLPVQTVQSTVADRTVHYGRLYSPLQWTVEGFSIKALNHPEENT